ncbi:MAG: metallophosphoesterase family protein [Candidatus Izemoplasmatales bacterium]
MKKAMLLMIGLALSMIFIGCTPGEQTTASELSVTERVQALQNPYMIMLFITEDATTSVGINFELPTNSDGYVEYRLLGNLEFIRLSATKKATTVGSNLVYLYEKKISNLLPDSIYEYRIGGGNDLYESNTYQFKTAQTNETETVFMLLSDPQGSDSIDYMTYANNVIRISEQAQKNVDFVMFTGDVVNDDDSRSQWNLLFKYSSIFSYNIPVAATAGNHETGSIFESQVQNIELDGYYNLPNNGPTYNDFDELENDQRTSTFDQGKTYRFDYGYGHFVAIDTELFYGDTGINGVVDEENIALFNSWLVADLGANADKWIIVYLHRGPYALTYDSYNVRQRLTPIFDQYGVDLVISGHDHRYSRAVISQGTMIDFTTADTYLNGNISLILDGDFTRNFNDYSSGLGVTYFVGNSSGTKFYGDTAEPEMAVTYLYYGENAVIPFFTVTETAIEVVSYLIEKSGNTAIFPDSISILESFIIRK